MLGFIKSAYRRFTAKEVDDLTNLQHRVAFWANETFPDADGDSMVKHLGEEVAELRWEIRWGWGYSDIKGEVADCLLILLHIADHYEINLMEAAEWKFLIAKARKWETSDPGRGYQKHIEESEL